MMMIIMMIVMVVMVMMMVMARGLAVFHGWVIVMGLGNGINSKSGHGGSNIRR